jgi:hypothetical protein
LRWIGFDLHVHTQPLVCPERFLEGCFYTIGQHRGEGEVVEEGLVRELLLVVVPLVEALVDFILVGRLHMIQLAEPLQHEVERHGRNRLFNCFGIEYIAASSLPFFGVR